MKRIVLIALMVALALPAVYAAGPAKPRTTKADYISEIMRLNEQLDKDPNNSEVLNRMIALHDEMLKDDPIIEPSPDNNLLPREPGIIIDAPDPNLG